MTTHPRVETPIVPKGQKREVIVLLDTSGSMEWEAADGSPITRWQIISEAMPQFVRALEAEDSAAAAERERGAGDGGGLLIHGFSNLHTALGDFNSSNLSRKWPDIQVGGGTTIMPAWRAAQEDYMEEFGDLEPTDRPALLTLVITDGEATDAAEFDEVLENAQANKYFAVAIVGHGEEHDRTLASYQSAAQSNPNHVAVVSFESVTNPRELAHDLIVLAGASE